MKLSEQSIAVIITAKNAAETIGQAVSSALAQVEATEVVVIDDGSSDETVSRARAEDDNTGRLNIISLPKNVGPSAARNIAIASSRSSLLCILDADDYMLAGRLKKLLEIAPEGWDFVADNMIFKKVGDPTEREDHLVLGPLDPPILLDADAFVRGNLSDPERPRRELGFLKPLIRRQCLADLGLGYDETMRLGEDYALYAEAIVRGARFWLTEACGYVAIEHPQSLSGHHRTNDIEGLIRADDRLLALVPRNSTTAALIGRHRTAVWRNLSFRRLLDAKREGQLDLALRNFLRAPLYIVSEVWKAKTGARRPEARTA